MIHQRTMYDRTGRVEIRPHAHIKVTHPRHAYHGKTGTVIRLDHDRRRVYFALPDGIFTYSGNRSIEVLGA